MFRRNRPLPHLQRSGCTASVTPGRFEWSRSMNDLEHDIRTMLHERASESTTINAVEVRESRRRTVPWRWVAPTVGALAAAVLVVAFAFVADSGEPSDTGVANAGPGSVDVEGLSAAQVADMF